MRPAAKQPCRPKCLCASGIGSCCLPQCVGRSGGLTDPTNALTAGEDHVVLAVGRDYADVALIDGVMLASGRQQLTTAVDVIPIEG